MPRRKPDPLPDTTAHNLRARADQLDAIANMTSFRDAQEKLRRQAQDLRDQADKSEQTKAPD